jgi:hypothetical protein
MIEDAAIYVLFFLCAIAITTAGVLITISESKLAGILILLGGLGFLFVQGVSLVFAFYPPVSEAYGKGWYQLALSASELTGFVTPIYCTAFSAGVLLLAFKLRTHNKHRLAGRQNRYAVSPPQL